MDEDIRTEQNANGEAMDEDDFMDEPTDALINIPKTEARNTDDPTKADNLPKKDGPNRRAARQRRTASPKRTTRTRRATRSTGTACP